MKAALCSLFALQFLSLPVAAEQLIAQGLKSNFDSGNLVNKLCSDALVAPNAYASDLPPYGGGGTATIFVGKKFGGLFQDFYCVTVLREESEASVHYVSHDLRFGGNRINSSTHLSREFKTDRVTLGKEHQHEFTHNTKLGITLYELSGPNLLVRYSCDDASWDSKKCLGKVQKEEFPKGTP